MTRTRSLAVLVAVAIVAIVGGLTAAHLTLEHGVDDSKPALADGTVYEPPRPLPAFALIDHQGVPFDRRRLENHWSLVFFGFASCPDICPTTLALLSQTEKTLSSLPERSRPQVVLVSVDPKRDTPEHLAAYVKAFSPTFIGVTGDPDTIDELARAMGVAVAIRESGGGGYSVEHSAAVFLVGPDATIRALFSRPRDAALLAADYRRMLGVGT
jgi:protein SCO1/2